MNHHVLCTEVMQWMKLQRRSIGKIAGAYSKTEIALAIAIEGRHQRDTDSISEEPSPMHDLSTTVDKLDYFHDDKCREPNDNGF